MNIGVLGLQGAIEEHENVIQNLGHIPIRVRNSEDLEKIDALIIPGGESTTIRKLIDNSNMFESLKYFVENNPTLGTCAGMILLSPLHFNILDIDVVRNGFGRQIDSFEENVKVKGIKGKYNAVFIRAPYISKINDKKIEILSKIDEKIIAVKKGNTYAYSFHPELTDDNRIIKMFIDNIKK